MSENKEENSVDQNVEATENTTAQTPEQKTKKVKEAKEEVVVEEPEYDLANFDWDDYEAGLSYSQSQVEDLKSKYAGTIKSIGEKELVSGTVIRINDREAVIDIGYKSEGIVPLNEFRYNPDIKVGDPVDLFIEKLENKTGQLEVSHKIARVHKAWIKVNECLETGEIITGLVKSRTKGGLIADVFGIEAFLPGSQIDVKPIRDYDLYVGKNMEFKVVKINHEFKNVVVSHKALIEAELEEQKKQIMSGLENGQVLQGIVKNITSYGVFVDLGGVDGLIHITDLSWKRVKHPEEIVTLDEKINVVILDFDDDKKRIALGLKQLEPHPWDALDANLEVDGKVKGKVVVVADYGAFVEIADGVEGLIHVSEMSWSQHLRSAQDFLSVGDEVEAVILTLDREERKMSLGLKQLTADPWENIESKYAVGSRHKSIVRNFTNFGVFTELEPGIDGLIHVSDLSWNKKIKHPSEFCAVGDELEVVVLELDKENRKLALGHKQIEENPWDVFEGVFSVGSVHQGTVIKIENKSAAIVSLPYGIEGYAPARHLKKADGSKANVDDVLDFVILEFDKGAKKIIVSHTATFEEVSGGNETSSKGSSNNSGNSAVDQVNSNSNKATLGDLGALADLKNKLEGN